jgi:exosortase A-associated hydrolase 1
MKTYSEKGAVFASKGNRLVGIAAVPEQPLGVGVLILVGGPQYRVGSHRQFTRMARCLAAAGIASFRFDYAGMGDSDGEKQAFSEVSGDISAAIDCFQKMVPGVHDIVYWGLCDAASSALMFAHREARAMGMVLLNPWVHTGIYSPEVKLSHYYVSRLRGKDAWRRFFSGSIESSDLVEFARETGLYLARLFSKPFQKSYRHTLAGEMLAGLECFKGRTLIILGEEDLTAREFLSLANNDKQWKRAVSRPQVSMHEVEGADHTFSKAVWHEKVCSKTIDWVKALSETCRA